MPGLGIGLAVKKALPMLIGTGASAVASGVANRRNNRTFEQTTTTKLTPEQQQLHSDLAARLGQRLANPSRSMDGVQALKNQARTNLNRSTKAAGANLENALAARGFERSGVAERGATQLEAARIDGLSNIEAQILQYIDQMSRQDEQQSIDNILRFLPETRDTTTSGVGPTQGSAIGSGLETFATLTMLQQLLGEGSSSGSPAASPASSGGGSGFFFNTNLLQPR